MEEQYLAPPTSVSLFVPTTPAVNAKGDRSAAPEILLASSLPPLPPLSSTAPVASNPPWAPSSVSPPPPPVAAVGAPPPPPPPVPKISEHPDYAKLFDMLAKGIPFPAVEQKAKMAGLRPELLSNPNAPITVLQAGGSSVAPSAAASEEQPSPPPPTGPPPLPPEYDRLLKMLKVGMPLTVVQHEARKVGLDPSLLPGS